MMRIVGGREMDEDRPRICNDEAVVIEDGDLFVTVQRQEARQLVLALAEIDLDPLEVQPQDRQQEFDAVRMPRQTETVGHVDKWRSQRRIDVMSMKPRKLSAVLS